MKMTMREIQDLTLDLARGADRLGRIFRERHNTFKEALEFVNKEHGACRITAIPLGSFPGIPRPSGHSGDFPIRTRFRANFGTDFELAGPAAIGAIGPVPGALVKVRSPPKPAVAASVAPTVLSAPFAPMPNHRRRGAHHRLRQDHPRLPDGRGAVAEGLLSLIESRRIYRV